MQNKIIHKTPCDVAEFDIKEIMGISFTIGITVVGIAYLLLTMGDVRDDMDVDSTEYNATGEGIDAVAKFPEKMKIIVTVVIAAIIIGILIRYLWGYVRGAM